MATQFQSATNSQASSFEDSIPSQGSYQHSASTVDIEREPTPSTSLSNPSSQEQMKEKANQPPSARRQRMDTHVLQASIAPMMRTAGEVGGTKRTADGQVKERSPTSPTVGRYAHSRTLSMTSRGSEIGELSSQLKTRLSYAFVKVQHGWQAHSLTELETLTSAHPSTQASPLTSPASTLRSPRSRPTSSSTLPIFPPSPAQHRLRIGTSGHDHAYQTATAPRTYDSFWREHSGNASANPPPSLAPPADITPGNAHPQRPRVQTTDTSPRAYAPTTPPPFSDGRPKPRTPSQNAAMEKDAVETLVFMSSPQNPGNVNSREQQMRSPLREVIDRAVDGRGVGRRGLTGREVNAMLEESSGEGSSSEEGA